MEVKKWTLGRQGGRGASNTLRNQTHGRRRSGKSGKGCLRVLDGSLLESRNADRRENVSSRALIVGTGGEESEVECGIGNVATVWDGEITGMAVGLAEA